MNAQDRDELVEAAVIFYQEAESPTEEDMKILFHALAFHDHGEIEELFDRFSWKGGHGPLITPWGGGKG